MSEPTPAELESELEAIEEVAAEGVGLEDAPSDADDLAPDPLEIAGVETLEIEALEAELLEARAEFEAVIEAVLFVAHDPVPRRKLVDMLGGGEAAEAAIAAVVARHAEGPARGVFVEEVAGGLRMVTRPGLHGWLRRFFEISGKNRLSMPALESLAIVAYRQPVTAPEIQELRGVGSSGVLKKLLEKRLVRITGRKEVVGKPFLYGTTREFLMHFGLRSLKELPPLDQFEELFAGDPEAEGEERPPDEEEEVLREVAALEEADDDAADEAERREIEAEREAAEAEDLVADEPESEAEVESGTLAPPEEAPDPTLDSYPPEDRPPASDPSPDPKADADTDD